MKEIAAVIENILNAYGPTKSQYQIRKLEAEWDAIDIWRNI